MVAKLVEKRAVMMVGLMVDEKVVKKAEPSELPRADWLAVY